LKHYPHHIGDFDKATRHLTRIERSIYRDLIDLYYDTEQQLPLDTQWICRRIIARTNEESTAVEQTLNEFFTKTPTGWYHARCEEEIERYRSNNSQKAMAGKASAAAKAHKIQQALNARSTDVGTDVERASNGTPTNQEPRTNNHKPINNTSSIAPPDGVSHSVWQDFKTLRKAKKSPITPSAIDGIRREASKAGWSIEDALRECCARGWAGFKAEWVAGNHSRDSEPSWRREERERMEAAVPRLAARSSVIAAETFEAEVSNVVAIGLG